MYDTVYEGGASVGQVTYIVTFMIHDFTGDQMADKNQPHRSSRTLRKESDRKLLWLVVFTLVVVGGGIIALIYGPMSLITSLPFLLGGAALVTVPYLILKGIEVLLNRYNGEE
ncbi:MAG: hypothetical protein GY943_29655 [Chloroflexi bacterium]|nr:hypothetical protein [Chloroflexota bacterium]